MVQQLKAFDIRKQPAPLEEGILTPLINEWLATQNDEEGPLATADGTRLRASFAGNCSRQIGFEVLGVPRYEPIPPETLMAFNVGNRFHAVVQEILVDQLDAEIEVIATWKPEHDLSCHADAVYEFEGRRVAVEIKTISGYGFDLAVGNKVSDDQYGPKPDQLTQGTMSALAPNVEATFVHMIYINKDKGTIAEWMIGVDDVLPYHYGAMAPESSTITPRLMVMNEIQRMTGIVENRIDQGMLPARVVPGYGKVGNPPSRNERGDPWNCRYCGWQGYCVQMPAEPTPIDDWKHLWEVDHAD